MKRRSQPLWFYGVMLIAAGVYIHFFVRGPSGGGGTEFEQGRVLGVAIMQVLAILVGVVLIAVYVVRALVTRK